MYVTRGMKEIIQKVYRSALGEKGITPHVNVHTYTISFSCIGLTVSCFICRNFTLPSSKTGVFFINGYFSPMRSVSVVIKYAFFNLNCFSESN